MTEPRYVTCPRCHGTRRVYLYAVVDGATQVGPDVTCPVCDGAGFVPAESEGEAA